MKNLQKGFTLIELMIVVAIIGILAMFALPAYQDYTKRTHVAEGLQLAASAKSAVTEFYASNGEWPTTNKEAGIADEGDIKGNAVKSVKIDGGKDYSTVTITYDTKKIDAKKNVIVMEAQDATGSVVWSCFNTGDDAVDTKYRPANCRKHPDGFTSKVTTP